MIRNWMQRKPALKPLAEGKGRVSLGLALVSALVILLFGSHLTWAGQAPLASVGWRALVAALLLLLWCVYYGIRHVVPRQTGDDLDRQGHESRMYREARQIHRSLTGLNWRERLFGRRRYRRHLWAVNVAGTDLERVLGLSGRKRIIRESRVLGVQVVELGALRLLVSHAPGDTMAKSRQDSVNATLARVLFSGRHSAPDALLWQVCARDIAQDENQGLMGLIRLNETLAARTARSVPLMIWVAGLDAMQGSEVVWEPQRCSVAGFDFDTDQDQVILNWHEGAQTLFEYVRAKVQNQLAEETDPAIRLRGLRFLTEVHDLLTKVERLLFRLANEVSVSVLTPSTFALGDCATRYADIATHPVLARIPVADQKHERVRWRKWLMGTAWVGSATAAAVFAAVTWQTHEATHSLLAPLSDALAQQAEVDRGAPLASLKAWEALRTRVAAVRENVPVSLSSLDAALEAGYSARLVRTLARDGESWVLDQVRRTERDYRSLAHLSRMVGAFEGRTEWTDALKAAWRAPWTDEPRVARWLADYIAMDHPVTLSEARAALLAAMAEVPLEDQVVARLLDDDHVSGLGYVDTETLLGPGARTWLRGKSTIRLPRYYTAAGYHGAFAPALEALLDELAQEAAQIQGDAAQFPRAALKAAAETAYAEAVMHAWSGVFDQIRIRRPRGDELGTYLAWLGSRTESPVRHLFESVVTLTDYGLTTTASRVAVEKALRLASLGTGSVARHVARAKRLHAALGESTTPEETTVEVPPQLREIQLRFREISQWLPGDHTTGRWDAMAEILRRLADELREQEDLSAEEQFAAASRQLTSARAWRDYRGWLRTARSLPQPARDWVVTAVSQYQVRQSGAVRSRIIEAYSALKTTWRTQFEGRYPFSAGGEDVDMAALERFFGPNGDMARFIETYIRPFTLTRDNGYRNKGGAGSLGFSTRALEVFAWADAVRKTLLDESGVLTVGMNWRPQYLDANLRLFELGLYDENLTYRHGPLLKRSTVWRSGADPERAVVRLVDYNGLTYHEAFQGPWALHRMLMQFRPRQISSTRYQVEFEVQGRRAVYDLSFEKPGTWPLLAKIRGIELVPLFD